MKAEEAEARAFNAQPWEPPPGMVKRQCPECRYFFAAPITSEDGKALPCPARLMYSSFVTGCSKETFWSQGTGIPLSRRLA
jgi:hypothetical protein